MRLALIAHGNMPIPSDGWGAVESILWNHKIYLERAGHTIDIFNSRDVGRVLQQIQRGNYDFVHCHNEFFVLGCAARLKAPWAVTAHAAIRKQPSGEYVYERTTEWVFKRTLHAPANIVLSSEIRDIYERAGYRGLLRVLRNGAETEKFRMVTQGNGKAICLGRVCGRKRQTWLSETAQGRFVVDFAGPWNRQQQTACLEHDSAKYLGAWDRQTVYEKLTNYSCLVLLSTAEGAPKVIPEALAAGLSVVVSEVCAANLTPQEFITVIPADKHRPDLVAQAIQTAIDKNAALRSDIRNYAWSYFDYEAVCRDYLRIIDEVREFYIQTGQPSFFVRGKRRLWNRAGGYWKRWRKARHSLIKHLRYQLRIAASARWAARLARFARQPLKVGFADRGHDTSQFSKMPVLRARQEDGDGALSVVHVSFGTEEFSEALRKLRNSAEKFGIKVRQYDSRHSVVRQAFEHSPEIMRQRRGAGYWLWKPYILLDTMDQVKPGTIIIYTDAGQRYIADPGPLFSLARSQDVVLFHSRNFVQRAWTKRDCFVLLEADEARYWDATQLDASIQLYRAGPRARDFLLELRKAMSDPQVLCDGPNNCGLPNFEEFRGHRHDQSILTILAIKHGIQTFPSPKYRVNKTLSKDANKALRDKMRRQMLIVFEHHRSRNKPARAYRSRFEGTSN